MNGFSFSERKSHSMMAHTRSDAKIFFNNSVINNATASFKVACVGLQVSRGLWKKYGDKRIMDTPITEVGMMINWSRTHLCMFSIVMFNRIS